MNLGRLLVSTNGIRQALHFKRLFRNVCLDLRYTGTFLGGTFNSRYSHLGSETIASTDYAVLPLIFDGRVGDSDVLVDVGCGRGRVISWWLSQGFRNRIIGIELDEAVARTTQRQFLRFSNVAIISGDAVEKLPAEGTIFYLYNPFKAFVVKRFKTRLAELLAPRKKAKTCVIYYNSVHVDIFRQDPNWLVREIGITTLPLWDHTVKDSPWVANWCRPLAVIEWRG